MKCLSVRQPWADLIVYGERLIEIRCWKNYYRGPLLIHASKIIDKPACGRFGLESGTIGAILGIVNLIDIQKVSESEYNRLRNVHLEVGFRIYGEKTFAWYLVDPARFRKPIPFIGRLGLFNVPDDIVPRPFKLLQNGRVTELYAGQICRQHKS